MLYSDFLEVLREDPQDPQNPHGMAAYLQVLARKVLDQLGQDADRMAVRRMAAISGLVRSCAPEALILLEGDTTLADLAGAVLDIVPGRQVMLARKTADNGWHLAPPDPTWMERVDAVAQALELPRAPPPRQAQPLSRGAGLVTTAPAPPEVYARHMPNLAYVLALPPGGVPVDAGDALFGYAVASRI